MGVFIKYEVKVYRRNSHSESVSHRLYTTYSIRGGTGDHTRHRSHQLQEIMSAQR